MFNEIQKAMELAGSPAESFSNVEFVGDSTSASLFPVSDIAQFSVGAAVSALQTLRRELWNVHETPCVYRGLASLWCDTSVVPQGWSTADKWDAFSSDYRVKDGWVRLHTNADAHRAAALKVLGGPSSIDEARAAASSWTMNDLETAVVEAGGAAAELRDAETWKSHPQGKAVAQEPIVKWDMVRAGSPLRLTDAAKPLKGLRVLDLTRVLAGPVCTRLLAAYGAEVLRIDPPSWSEPVSNAIDMTAGKHCAGLDLRDADDRATFEKLLSSADILVHGYRNGALTGLGYGSEKIREINPELIDTALNAYGWTGPWAQRRGFDSLVQRSCGIVDACMQHARSEKTIALPFQALDHATGYLMAAATLHAIRSKVLTGKVYSARLSLARQAKLLMDAPRTPEPPKKVPEVTEEDILPLIEETPWGMVKRLKFPFHIESVDPEWTTSARQLRSDPPRWRTG